MPFTDPVSSISGRNSRASNVSGVTGASRSIRSQPIPQQVDTIASAGVMSMLKTSTDTGDIGALSYNTSGLPTMPRAIHPRRGHNPRLSGPSISAAVPPHHHYAPSQASKISSSRDWDSLSNQRRGSFTSMQSMPPSLPPVHLGKGTLQMPPPIEGDAEARSYSMTSALPPQSLPRLRSATSLQSAGHGQHSRQQMVQPMVENRPPYVYPTRLKRPGYRSPSPALSDSYAQNPPPPPPMARRMPMPPRGPPQPYGSEYGMDYAPDPRRMNIRPPPRVMSTSPVMDHRGPPPGHFPYSNAAAAQSAPGLTMPVHSPGFQGPGSPHLHPSSPPPFHQQMYAYPQQPMMPRPPYAGAQYSSRAAYSPYAQSYQTYPSPRPPIAAPSHVTPAAHQIFHNAARMARQMPQRTDTPMTDGGAPSSDPPSSGTAPSSSSPPTPRDGTSIQVAVDPLFIDAALVDLQDSSSEPVLAHQYLRYTEALEKAAEETDIEAAHKSVPPSGFVQRVRAMLESKAAAESATQKDGDREKPSQHHHHAHNDPMEMHLEAEDESNVRELAADETSRFMLLEEFNAPVELPASPVRLPELAGSPVQVKGRITRELVKAELGPSSTDNTTRTETGDTTSIDMEIYDGRVYNSDEDQSFRDPQGTEPKVAASDEPSTPGPTSTERHDERQDDVELESCTTSSPAALTLGLSGADYAMRFEVTTSSEETRSKDPFILDADTITLQHQRSKEKVNQPEHDAGEPTGPRVQNEFDLPVSPLLTGEDVSRVSAVSPLHTLGIDETLHKASEVAHEDPIPSDELDIPGAFPEDSYPPPTPRTPKTYSKSVQLPQCETFIDTPTSNRRSLPPELSTFAETTMNSTSDMVTDIAVRFSLPQTTVTVSKPQIVEIAPTSSPEPTPPKPNKPAFHTTSKPKRGSVSFADDVAPLSISRKPDPRLVNSKAPDARPNKGKSIIRRPSPLQEANESNRLSRDSTTDLRFSGIHNINNKFGSTHLPRLKEESVEEMSISDKHRSDLSNGFQFPLPARIAAVKAMQERRLQESAEKARARRAHRLPNRPLADTRDLPSLNFSRMDLIDKLNEALDVRTSKSMEVMRRREFSGIYCPSPQRPQSTEPLRGRYMSFFSKPEDFTAFFSDFIDSEDGDDNKHSQPDPLREVPVVEVHPQSDHESAEGGSRPLSPEDLLNVATQVNRLSIPSVTGLSERLSELLPDLRDLHLDSVLASFEEIAEDIRRLGDGLRPETVLSSRTSGGFRSLAERAEAIVKNGTHDSTIPISKLLGVPLPESMSAGKVSGASSVDGKQSYLSGSASAPSELGQDLCRPQSALTRQRSPTTEDEVQTLLPPEMNPIARNSNRSLVISSSSRPWNQDENYPWAGTKLDVNLTVPIQAHTRNSFASEVLRQRRTKSLDISSTGEPTNTKGIDIRSIIEHDTTTSLTSEQCTGMSKTLHIRKPSKHSMMGSLTKKIGLAVRSGHGNTTTSIASPTSMSDVDRSASTLPHRPGERYPTSSLTPPAAFNLDEVRSFFSDDSSEKDRSTSFRKRLTNFKNKKNIRVEPPRAPSMDGNTAYDPGEITVERVGATSSAHTFEGVGMGKTEFRIKRFGEKLRNLMAKGGELIRSLSQRSKPSRNIERVRDEWLSDSLYSGV